MKKVLFTITILVSMIGNLYANNLQLAQGFYNNDDIENAVSAINNAMNSPQNKTNPEAWILMYRIFKKAQTSGPYSSFPDDCISKQHRAIRELMLLSDGKNWMEKEFGSSYINIFNKFYSEFVTYANNSMKNKNFGNAHKNYKNALKVYDDIYKYGLDPSPVDTALIFNVGFSALQNENYAETEIYFKKLADIPVKNQKYAMIYAWLSKYYILETKDLNLAANILAKGLSIFPNNQDLNELVPYLNSIETQKN